DQNIRDWEHLGSQIGMFVETYLKSNSVICFLPGRDFTGLPLHLIKMPCGIRLLEKTTVRFAPNFATLLALPEASESGRERTAVITVTKRQESAKFRSRALRTANEIYSLLRPTNETF